MNTFKIRKNKHAISPVVATALLLVVAVISVVGFQGWFTQFSSSTLVNVESQSSNSLTSNSIEGIYGNNLYIKSGTNNSPLKSINIGGEDCQINENLSKGINKIDITSCIENLSTQSASVVVVTDSGIYEKEVSNPKLSQTNNKITPPEPPAPSTYSNLSFSYLSNYTFSPDIVDPREFVLNGNYLYLANRDYSPEGFQAYDVSNPSAITLAGQYTESNHNYGVTVNGNYAYVSGLGGRLFSLDISNPAAITTQVTRSSGGNTAYNTVINGNNLYLISRLTSTIEGRLTTYDISNPAFPTQTNVKTLSGNRVYTNGNYLYVASYSYDDSLDGLQTYDISTTPNNPNLVSSNYHPGLTYSELTSYNDVLYAFSWSNTIHLYNISSPNNPTYIKNITGFGSGLRSPIIYENFLIYTGYTDIVVYDISDSLNPKLVSSTTMVSDSHYSKAFNGNHLFISDNGKGIFVYTPTLTP